MLRDIEELKNELILKSDFNAYQAFKYLDLENKEILIKNELKYALKDKLSILPSNEELDLLYLHFGKEKDIITYPEFIEIVQPLDL